MTFQHDFRRRVRLAVTLALLGGSLTCSYPDDVSEQVVVLISPPTSVVLRGEQLLLLARAFRVAGSDTTPVSNVTFVWSSTDPTLATVQDVGGDSAIVTGIDTGSVEIRARAVPYEGSVLGIRLMRVASALAVDSVRPNLVRYGDTLTVFGIGVDSFLFSASLTPGQLIAVPSSEGRDSSGIAHKTYWVPFPARTGRLSYLGPGVFGNAPETTSVMTLDIYEPSDTFPINIGLDGPRPFPQSPNLIYINPALAFEQLKIGDSVGFDWYRLLQAIPRDLTIILTAPTVAGTFTTFLTDSLRYGGVPGRYVMGDSSWTIGPGSHACHGAVFTPVQQVPDSTIVALAGLPNINIHVLSRYRRAGGYGLTMIQGYVVSDAVNAPRDAHEEDDFCNAADAPAKRVTVPFRDTLTIDNPTDVDWIRFTWPGGPLRLRTAAVGDTGAVAETDIDLYLAVVPSFGPGTLSYLKSDAVGSVEDINFTFAAGDYYAVVVDKAGVPTAYDLCIGTCATFPAVAAARRAVAKRQPTWTRPPQLPLAGGPVQDLGRPPSARP